MGNQFTTLSQIYPVEYYLADHSNNLTFDAGLGSTRFMKVARVNHKDAGYCVAKIYALHDPNLNLEEYKKRLEHIRDVIGKSGELHSLPFSLYLVNEKSIILLRQYIKYNLYDRLSTRPFLCPIEKRWVAYQLLRCLQSLHKRSIYHGDIKSENILVTSFLWITLADFAFYKPVTLPENNPSDFSYFFDTSRRHCCNMAPERFVEPTGLTMESESNDNVRPYVTDPDPVQITQQMDMFSLGCVLAELFSDDTPNSSIFDLGQILMFRKNQYDPTKFLEDGIGESDIRRLILNMIELDPNKRNSATYHLDRSVPSIFPAYFNLLYNFFVKLIPMSPDAKIMTLDTELDNLMEVIITEYDHGLLIVLILITSTLRSLQSIDAKLVAIKLCVRLVKSSSIMSEYIIDRLLPYIIQLLASAEPRVRAMSVNSLSIILKQVKKLQPSDSNVFIDYIVPKLMLLAIDESALVRLTLASNISELAETSRMFLDPTEHDYKLKLTALHDCFGSTVVRILKDTNNHVRRALLNQNLSDLCDFLGPDRTEEVIFRPMIEFLKDKADFRLRASFYEHIPFVAKSLGLTYSQVFLKPLFHGLADSEEIVIHKCVQAISLMTKMGLLTKDVIYELFQEAVPLVSFPNKWIRNAVIEFIVVLSKAEQLIDFSRILPAIKLHLNKDMHGLRDEVVLFDSLQNPLPRPLIESILNSQDDIKIFEYITNRKLSREKKKYRNLGEQIDMQNFDSRNDSTSPEGSIRSLMDSLGNVDKYSEDKLIDSEVILKRIHDNKRHSSSRPVEPNISVRRHDAIVHDLSNFDSKLLISSTELSCGKAPRPKGILLAHLHEHKAGINKLLVVPETNIIASCSNDATIKLWDISRVATKPQTLFRSKRTIISPDAGSISTVTLCIGSESMLFLTTNNNLNILPYSVDAMKDQIKTVNLSKDLSTPETVTDIVSLSPYTYATCATNSHLRGYDLRLPFNSHVWSLKLDGRDGLITCIDGNELTICCGTSSSVIALFDLRFYIQATTMSYPPFQDKMKKRIRRVLLRNDDIYCAVDGNNEVTTWNCESGTRSKTLWASQAPCLSSVSTSHQSVQALLVDDNKASHSIITAGDDMKIRFWDLNEPHRSHYINGRGPIKDQMSCQVKLVDGIQVYRELNETSNSNQDHAPQNLGSSPGHHDTITSLLSHQNLLLSASKDGVIKIWR